MKYKVTRVENMKNDEHVNMKKISIHCVGILGGEEIGGNRKMALILGWPRREHYRLVPQELCCTAWASEGVM